MNRNNLFENIVIDENSFTELLCNLLSLSTQFKEKFFKFLGIRNHGEYEFDTQYPTDKKQKNGRVDLIIYSDEKFFFIENKINNTGLTENQPKGYLRELSKMDYHKKNLYFIVPRYYSHMDELNKKLPNNNSKICTKILFWDDFFESYKEECFQKNDSIISEFFQLIKEWFGYEHIELPKKGDIEMNVKEMGKQLRDFHKTIYTIEDLIKSYGFKTKPMKIRGEIGFGILKNDTFLGCFEIWNELWAEKGDIFVFVPINECDFAKKEFKFEGKSYPYTSLDSRILNGNFEEKAFVDYFIKEILKKLTK
jgi:hypothetical protein